MLNIAEALASHTSHALPLTCGATQTSPPYLSQRPHSRAGRQPTVPLTCRRRQNRKMSSARTCERPYDEARNIAKAACSHRVHVRLHARAPAPSSPPQPGWCTGKARKLTSATTHAHMHHNQRSNHALLQPLQSLRELGSHLSSSRPSAAAREGRRRRRAVIEGCRAQREVIIARSRSAFSILPALRGRTRAGEPEVIIRTPEGPTHR